MARSKVMALRLSAEDYEIIRKEAAKAGKTVSSYAYDRILEKPCADKSVSVDTITTLTALYNCMCVPADEWTPFMEKQFKRGVAKGECDD